MADLASWLLEQIADDERMALRMDESSMHGVEAGDEAAFMHFLDTDHIRAECDAKRRIIAELYDAELDAPALDIRKPVADHLLRLLALPYADRPGYDESWRP